MKRLKQFTKWMKGFLRLYFMAVVILIALQYFRTLTPLFVQHIIDAVLSDQPSALPGFIQDIVAADSIQRQLLLVAIFSVAFTLLRVILFFGHRFLLAHFAENTAYRLRNALYQRLQDLSFTYHSRAETGDLIQRTTTDVETYRVFIGDQLIEVLRMIFLITFAVIQMSRMESTLTIISMAVAPIIFFSAFIYFTFVKRVFKRVEEAEGTMTTTLQENVTGIRVVKAFANETFEIDKFDNTSKTFRDENQRLINLMAYYWSLSDFLIFIQFCLTASFGIYFTVQGRMGPGEYIAFLAYVGMIVWPLRQMGRIIGDFGKTTVALDRIDEIINQQSEHEDDAQDTPPITGHIEFDKVTFQFDDDDKPLLKNVSFTIDRGETVAIVGKTGSGKSTLINLLIRLLENQEGRILFDGQDIKTINKRHLRKHVGIILQEPFLYSKTVYENIGIMNKRADKDKVFNAASIARVHEDIINFEAGYETMVGERGVTLSGGQKQRVAIARMLLDDKPVLVFDDSLSAVDTETDIQIRRALNSYWKNTTVILITHRIITAKEADKIIVLDEGEIIEYGTHASLLEQNGMYAELWDIQSSLLRSTVAPEKEVG
ncbi:MAG: ABC transporter ATP-binding protein [Acholeplasmatales bacterium]|nr:MAG: ABC transporter ATP-binding protein [Acholeplasmatales bacterium]